MYVNNIQYSYNMCADVDLKDQWIQWTRALNYLVVPSVRSDTRAGKLRWHYEWIAFTAFLYWHNSHELRTLTTSKHSRQIIKWMPIKSVMFDCIIDIHLNECIHWIYQPKCTEQHHFWAERIRYTKPKIAAHDLNFGMSFCLFFTHFQWICQIIRYNLRERETENYCF